MSKNKITRIEIISQHGRELVHRDLKDVQLSYQDNDRTLKIFIKLNK